MISAVFAIAALEEVTMIKTLLTMTENGSKGRKLEVEFNFSDLSITS